MAMHQLSWLGRACAHLLPTRGLLASLPSAHLSLAPPASPASFAQPSSLASVHNLVSRSKMMHNCCSSMEHSADLHPRAARVAGIDAARAQGGRNRLHVGG
mmetsp:Transcript_9739/g.24999  ORF Transcript_9739/g.24999 Transcript_9739/m.24999 type:complete len:101 (+) Transcript_9739:359-661(+)